MSKLYDTYLYLKKNSKDSNNFLYLFKSGMFYIFLDEDAKIASQFLNLKLTYFTDKILKCGFPINSLEKYSNILNTTSYKLKIIDTIQNTIYDLNDYHFEKETQTLLLKIANINIDNLSIKEAYDFIEDIKVSAKILLEKEKNLNE